MKHDPFRIVTQLFGVTLTHDQSQVFERAIKKAAAEVFPDTLLMGNWVHEGVRRYGVAGKALDREASTFTQLLVEEDANILLVEEVTNLRKVADAAFQWVEDTWDGKVWIGAHCSKGPAECRGCATHRALDTWKTGPVMP